MRLIRVLLIAVSPVVVPVLAACSDDGGDDGGDTPRLVVSAAASMSAALSECAPDFEGADVRLSFAGSDELAAQIRQGARPDVFAAANTEIPDDLAADGLLIRPVAFATNELVVAVPSESEIDAVGDLAADGTSVAIGDPSVPVGTYTRELLSRLPADERDAILANVRSEEPDVTGIVGKLTQGAADAGFVYASDVVAARPRLRAVELPSRLEPTVVYAAGVVVDAEQPELARHFLDSLVGGPCQDALRAAGFGALE